MIDQADRDALLKVALSAAAICLAALFLSCVLGLSIHLLRVIGGI